MRRWCAGILAAGLIWAAALPAQQLQPGVPQSPVLIVEPERLFSQSAFGQRVGAQLEAEGAAIAAENRRIEAELTDEERALTERRPSLPAAEFRALADAFDEKVEALRREQDAKARSLGARTEAFRRQFLNAAQPVLVQLMREAGAAVIVERRAVFLSADAVDITDIAVERIDSAIGDGGDLAPPDE